MPLIVLAVAVAQAAPSSQSILRAATAAPTRQMAAPEQPAQADATFGETIEAALTETAGGSGNSFADPSGRFMLLVQATSAARLVNLTDTHTSQVQTWTIAPNASPAALSETVGQILKASGQIVAEGKSGVGPLSDLGK